MLTKEQLQNLHAFMGLVFVQGPASEVSKMMNEISQMQQALQAEIKRLDDEYHKDET